MGQPLQRKGAPETGYGPVLDIIHLQSMTLGDDGLARELLALFDTQAALLTEEWGNSGTDTELSKLARSFGSATPS